MTKRVSRDISSETVMYCTACTRCSNGLNGGLDFDTIPNRHNCHSSPLAQVLQEFLNLFCLSFDNKLLPPVERTEQDGCGTFSFEQLFGGTLRRPKGSLSLLLPNSFITLPSSLSYVMSRCIQCTLLPVLALNIETKIKICGADTSSMDEITRDHQLLSHNYCYLTLFVFIHYLQLHR